MIDLLDIISPQSSAYLPWILALLILPIFSFATTGFMKGKAPYWSSAIIASNLLVAAYLATVFWNEPLTIRGNWFKLGENQFTYSF